jgi:hypothetical protein
LRLDTSIVSRSRMVKFLKLDRTRHFSSSHPIPPAPIISTLSLIDTSEPVAIFIVKKRGDHFSTIADQCFNTIWSFNYLWVVQVFVEIK